MSRIPSLFTLATLLTLVLPAFTRADSSTLTSSKQPGSIDHVETTLPGIKLSGYVDAGYIYNFISPAATASTQGYDPDRNARGDFNVNAVKLTLEKSLTCESDFQAGFRVDVMVGEDAAGLATNVAGASSLYLQQAFALLRAPLGQGLDIKVGRFASMMGYEADERPANLNITGGINARLDTPPAPGILLQYPCCKLLTLTAGIVNGAVGDTNNGLDTDNDGYALIGGAGLKNCAGNAELQFNFHWAPWGDPGFGSNAPLLNQENEDVLGLNLWADWRPLCCSDKLMLAVNSSYWTGRDYTSPNDTLLNGNSDFWTVACYTKYQFTPLFSLAGRAEYAHCDDDQLLGLVPNTPGFALPSADDIWTWTLTAGFNLTDNLLLRAEYRIDFGDDIVSKNSASETGNLSHGVALEMACSF